MPIHSARTRRNKVKGIQFTIMVVGVFTVCPCTVATLNTLLGASGSGRTTFVNTLCESDVLPHKVCDAPEEAHLEERVKIQPATVGMSVLAATKRLSNVSSQN
jgi:cell division control protein 11